MYPKVAPHQKWHKRWHGIDSKIALTMDTYTHIGLHGQRAASEGLPALPTMDKNDSGEDESVALKTGTDDQPVGACKNLAENSYFDGLSASPIGTAEESKNQKDAGTSTFDKSLAMVSLGTEKEAL